MNVINFQPVYMLMVRRSEFHSTHLETIIVAEQGEPDNETATV